jgi:CBS domain-containing protein
MKVGDVMTRDPVVVGEDTTLAGIARLMLERQIGCVPVIDDQRMLVGIITQADFIGNERNTPFSAFLLPRLAGDLIDDETLELIRSQAHQTFARQLMRTDVVTTTEDELLGSLVKRMVARSLKRFPVVRDGKVVGIVSRCDLLRILVPDAG